MLTIHEMFRQIYSFDGAKKASKRTKMMQLARQQLAVAAKHVHSKNLYIQFYTRPIREQFNFDTISLQCLDIARIYQGRI